MLSRLVHDRRLEEAMDLREQEREEERRLRSLERDAHNQRVAELNAEMLRRAQNERQRRRQERERRFEADVLGMLASVSDPYNQKF